MAFWKKNERRKRELEGIKNRVEGKQALPPPPGLENSPPTEPEPEQLPQTPAEKPIPKPITKPAPKITQMQEEAPEPSAPLFIKIEKYEDVLEKLQELKNTLQTLTRLISFHAEVDELKSDIFSRIKNTVSSLTDSLISMDEIFVKPERPDLTESEKSREERGVEEQILDLGEELRHLKRELTKIE